MTKVNRADHPSAVRALTMILHRVRALLRCTTSMLSNRVLPCWRGTWDGRVFSTGVSPLFVHASDLGSIGQFIGACVTAGGFVWGLIRHKDILTWFADRKALNDKLTLAELKAANQEQRAIAAEQRALNWEKGATGAQFDVDQMEKRLEQVEAIVPRFNALMDFTKKLLKYTVYLEQEAVNAGVKLSERMPEIPDALNELRED